MFVGQWLADEQRYLANDNFLYISCFFVFLCDNEHATDVRFQGAMPGQWPMEG